MLRIFLHGLGQTPESWGKTIAGLNAAEHSLCPNLADLLRGKNATYENLYEAFSEICEELDEKIDLCGLSLGGVLALQYTIEHPEKVNSLALIAAQYKMPVNLLKLQNFLFRFMPKSSFQQTGFGKREFMLLCKTMMTLDFSSSVGEVRCPVLVIYGEKDSANKKAALELADNLKNAQLQVIPGAGHEVNLEAPEKLAEVLRDFYKQDFQGCFSPKGML